jgi:hypothetical protein
MFDPVDLPHRADALHLDTGPVGPSGPCRRQRCKEWLAPSLHTISTNWPIKWACPPRRIEEGTS